MDNNQIDIFHGEGKSNTINGIFCTIDILKKDSEIKIIIGCTEKEYKQLMFSSIT